MISIEDKLHSELLETQRNAKKPEVEPTEEEKKNGWTKDSLNAYLAERNAGQSLAIDVNSLHRKLERRPTAQNHKYCPHRWR